MQGNIDHKIERKQNENENKNAKNNDGNDDNMIEFYLLDMEGLRHQVTKFTEKLFYACYATANLVVWSDKKVASECFQMLMNKFKTNMAQVATTALSMTKKLVSENPILHLFLIEQSNERFRRDMIYVAIHFNWDNNLLEKCFDDELNKLRYNPSKEKIIMIKFKIKQKVACTQQMKKLRQKKMNVHFMLVG